jgi:hypothetical protein
MSGEDLRPGGQRQGPKDIRHADTAAEPLSHSAAPTILAPKGAACFPVRDDHPTLMTPVVTIVLILATWSGLCAGWWLLDERARRCGLLANPRIRVQTHIIFVIILRIIGVPAWLVLMLWFALQLLSGYSTTSGRT